jgi:hypothetical protein
MRMDEMRAPRFPDDLEINRVEKKEQGRSPARIIVSTLFPRMFGFILD